MIFKTIVLFAVQLLFISSVNAAQYAIVAGVNRYQYLDPKLQLNGAVNDAKRMANYLQKSGFNSSEIRLLIDDNEPTQQARRSVILGELKQLISKVKDGDLVVVYFAMHGSQQPIISKRKMSEADDLDEILLPADVKAWNGKHQKVDNAILDDELDILFGQMREKGAFVVAIFDTCHAGTMARGADSEKARYVSMNDLQIPRNLQLLKWRTRGFDLDDGKFPKSNTTTRGGFIGMYASQSNQLTKEAIFENGEWRGVFSHHLIKALTQNSKASYRQIYQEILAQYRGENRWQITPQFEGNNLDNRVWDIKQISQITQWELVKNSSSLLIPAGSLHRISQDTKFSLHQNAGSDEIIAYASVDELQPDYTKLTISNIQNLSPKEIIERAKFVRLLHSTAESKIKIALNLDDPRLRTLMAKLKEKSSELFQWTSEKNADYKFSVDVTNNGQLCLSRMTEPHPCGSQAFKFKLDLNKSEETARAMWNIAQNLNVALKLIEISNTPFNQHVLQQIDFKMFKILEGKEIDWPLGDPKTTLNQGDKFRLSISNRSSRPIDVTVLVLDSNLQIQALYPSVPGANRIEPMGIQDIFPYVDGKTKGAEHLFLFVSEVYPLKITDYSFLEQKGLYGLGISKANYSNLRGNQSDMLSALKNELGLTRSQVNLPRTTVKRYTWVIR